MTLRQRILKKIYPLFVALKSIGSGKKILVNEEQHRPTQPFHALTISLIDGRSLPLSKLRGKKILAVNTASNCGFTNQYSELQKLHEMMKDELVIIGFPANDFKEQESGSNEEIASFCSSNFGVSFHLARKASVVKGLEQNPVFRWLSHKEQNGWNDQPPRWNFSKYLIDEEGVLTHYFDPAVSPLSEEVMEALKS
jgi:glutathione peroxidase